MPTQHHDLQALLEWATDHGYFDGNVIGDLMPATTEAERKQVLKVSLPDGHGMTEEHLENLYAVLRTLLLTGQIDAVEMVGDGEPYTVSHDSRMVPPND